MLYFLFFYSVEVEIKFKFEKVVEIKKINV